MSKSNQSVHGFWIHTVTWPKQWKEWPTLHISMTMRLPKQNCKFFKICWYLIHKRLPHTKNKPNKYKFDRNVSKSWLSNQLALTGVCPLLANRTRYMSRCLITASTCKSHIHRIKHGHTETIEHLPVTRS